MTDPMHRGAKQTIRWGDAAAALGRAALFTALAGTTTGCTKTPDGVAADGAAVAAGSSRLELGHQNHLEVCARCHDSGVDGAPVIGEPGDWTARSHLWQSVLFKHAESGYLDMPAQAGSDGKPGADAVNAAAEYMLVQSHPTTPPD